MDSGDSKIKTPKAGQTTDSSSSSPKSKVASKSSGSKEIIVDSAVPSPKKTSTSSSSVIEEEIALPTSPPQNRKTLARSVKINIDDEGEEDPRPIPKPRVKSGEIDQTDAKKNRPKNVDSTFDH